MYLPPQWRIIEILLQIGRVPWARLHSSTLGLYFVRPFTTIVNNDEGTFPIWFQLSFLESSSKDKISFAESPWFDDFLPLTRGLAMVLGQSDGRSLSFSLELVQSLSELEGFTGAKGFEPGFNGYQCFGPKHEGVRSFPDRLGVVR